jgi:hypothetical protein
MCDENTRCGSYEHKYQQIRERRSEILSKLYNGIENYHTHALWKKVIESMAMGADPLQIIEQLMDINIRQTTALMKKVLAEPFQVSVTQLPGAVLWIPINKTKLPTGEVLARNNHSVLLGVLIETIDPNTGIACTNEDGGDTIWLNHVTHYITIENLLK